jgi:hypothetical protein
MVPISTATDATGASAALPARDESGFGFEERA